MNENIGPGHGASNRNRPIFEAEFKRLGARIAQMCPLTWTAITGKRYLVPNHRQADYYGQEALDNIMAFFLSTYIAGDYGKAPDHIIRLMFIFDVTAINE